MPFIEDIEQLAKYAERMSVEREMSDLELLAELHMRVYDFVRSLPESCYVLDGEVSLILPDHTAVLYLDAKISVKIICSKLSANGRDLLWSDDSLRGVISKASAGFDALVEKYRSAFKQ